MFHVKRSPVPVTGPRRHGVGGGARGDLGPHRAGPGSPRASRGRIGLLRPRARPFLGDARVAQTPVSRTRPRMPRGSGGRRIPGPSRQSPAEVREHDPDHAAFAIDRSPSITRTPVPHPPPSVVSDWTPTQIPIRPRFHSPRSRDRQRGRRSASASWPLSACDRVVHPTGGKGISGGVTGGSRRRSTNTGTRLRHVQVGAAVPAPEHGSGGFPTRLAASAPAREVSRETPSQHCRAHRGSPTPSRRIAMGS